jgi:hypothetical protein
MCGGLPLCGQDPRWGELYEVRDPRPLNLCGLVVLVPDRVAGRVHLQSGLEKSRDRGGTPAYALVIGPKGVRRINPGYTLMLLCWFLAQNYCGCSVDRNKNSASSAH